MPPTLQGAKFWYNRVPERVWAFSWGSGGLFGWDGILKCVCCWRLRSDCPTQPLTLCQYWDTSWFSEELQEMKYIKRCLNHCWKKTKNESNQAWVRTPIRVYIVVIKMFKCSRFSILIVFASTCLADCYNNPVADEERQAIVSSLMRNILDILQINLLRPTHFWSPTGQFQLKCLGQKPCGVILSEFYFVLLRKLTEFFNLLPWHMCLLDQVLLDSHLGSDL